MHYPNIALFCLLCESPPLTHLHAPLETNSPCVAGLLHKDPEERMTLEELSIILSSNVPQDANTEAIAWKPQLQVAVPVAANKPIPL